MTYIFKVYNFEYNYEVGDMVTEGIVLNEPYHDQGATLEKIESVPYSIEEIYTVDSSVYAKAKIKLVSFFYRPMKPEQNTRKIWP